MSFKTPSPISIQLIKEFVFYSKKNAFASSGSKVTLTNQSSVFSVRGYGDENYSGDKCFSGLIYNDEYSGNTVEAGQETVSSNLCNIWRNQYYGGSFLPFWTGANVSELKITSMQEIHYLPFITVEFLKQALTQLPKSFPVRGPEYFQADAVEYEGNLYYGKWEYQNHWKRIPIFNSLDPFAAFQGEETIMCNGIPIYWHGYQGGFLRDKYYPIILEN